MLLVANCSARRAALGGVITGSILALTCGCSDSGDKKFVLVNPPAVVSTGGTPAGTGGAGGLPGTGGTAGVAGMVNTGTGGMMAGAGGMMAGAGGMMAGTGGMMAGTGGTGGTMTPVDCGGTTATDGRPTSGPLACIVEQHNATRAKVMSGSPLPPVKWSAELAKYAQEWTDMTCMSPRHRTSAMLNGQPLGENLYASFGLGDAMAGKQAVDGWSAEVACYTFGAFEAGDKCDVGCYTMMNSDGCGHYTQIVWRGTTEIGCGVTTCGTGFMMATEVICNYSPPGNYIGQPPY
jgi:hypothetical protein